MGLAEDVPSVKGTNPGTRAPKDHLIQNLPSNPVVESWGSEPQTVTCFTGPSAK